MTKYERASQIWPLLVYAASKRQVLTYDIVASAITVPTVALGQLLEVVEVYCREKRLPELTALVVKAETGLPGCGFRPAPSIPESQAKVFAFDWTTQCCPMPREFEGVEASAVVEDEAW